MNNYQQQNGPWFVHLNGSSVGPLPVEELRSLAQRTVVNEETMVSVDGRNWQRAAHAIPGLFANHTTGARSGNVTDYFKPGEQWFVNTYDGKQYGPVAYTELMSWIVGKTLTTSCLVRRESDPQWHRVGDVFGEHKPVQAMTAAAPRPSYVPPSFPQTPSPQPTFTPPHSTQSHNPTIKKTTPKVKQASDPAEWLIALVGTAFVLGLFYVAMQGMGHARTRGYYPIALVSFFVIRGLVSYVNSPSRK